MGMIRDPEVDVDRLPWKIGIVGLGHVGQMTKAALGLRARLTTYDISSTAPYPFNELETCDFLVVCVNTPSTSSGAADLSYVHAAFRALPPYVPVVVRSTVPPGTCDRLAETYSREVIFWPEYVGEKRFVLGSWETLDQRPFHVFGATRTPSTARWLDFISETYGPLAKLYQVDPAEAELVKYMENSYFAVKTTFVNEFRHLSDSLGLDWQRVREGWLLDPRVDRDHSDAFRSAPGFGGRCLPKDVSAILWSAEEHGVTMPLLTAAQTVNERIQTSVAAREKN